MSRPSRGVNADAELMPGVGVERREWDGSRPLCRNAGARLLSLVAS